MNRPKPDRRTLALACAAGLATASVAGSFAAAAEATHLVVVPTSAESRAALAGSSVREIAAYASYTLVEAADGDVARLVAVGGEVRDDMREMRIGGTSTDPMRSRPSLAGSLRLAASDGFGLAVVQYVGPLKDSWVDAVRATGVEVVSYMAQNGQLVSGDGAAMGALANLSGKAAFIRAVTPYAAGDKLVLDRAGDKALPRLNRTGVADFVISTVAGKAGAAARAELARIAVKRGDPVPVAGIVQHRVALDVGQVDALAALGGVVAVEPTVPPQLFDERAARIVAGQIDAGFQPILGTGHRAYLASKGLGAVSPVIIDITDEGIDKGVVPAPAGSHPDFHVGGKVTNPSRILYAQEATPGDPDARDCGGHGTNVASIASGYNDLTGAAVEDAQGFNYGVGIQPFGKLGATKIFNCAGSFDVSTSLTALHSAAYGFGARISNNSWGANVGGAYTASSQEFDALVRDAQPGVAGNQQFTEVFAAGNSGSGGNTIGAPGTAKNVITVGASENARQIGFTDGCGVTDAEANSARDIIDFSSRGPTDDQRTKPDVVAPGTHVTGAQPQTGAEFNGSGTCNPQFPAASTRYTLVSGTSQATPEVSGFASLIHSWYRGKFGGGSVYPSPAMTKALMVNTATDLAGGVDNPGGVLVPVPNQVQGWGRINLGTLLDSTVRQVVDQKYVLTQTGSVRDLYVKAASAGLPLRVTLAWTDAPGPTTGNAFVNDLDLEVTFGGATYKGNVFSGGRSVAGGVSDPRNNLESIFLPKGFSGSVKVRVIARNIAGDGVPGNADATDQDYALVVSNASAPVAVLPVLVDAKAVVAAAPGGDGDAYIEPGEPFTIVQKLKNVGNTAATSVTGKLAFSSSYGTATQPARNWPSIAANAIVANSPPFGGTVKATLACGTVIPATISVTMAGSTFKLPVPVQTGRPTTSAAVVSASADVPKAIPDNNPAGVTSNLALSGAGKIKDIDVTIGSLTHTYVGDLQMDLTSPAGTVVQLFNRNGGSGDNLTNTVFDDQAATAIASGIAPFTGSFKPSSPLSAFNGQAVSGTWKLTIRDLAGADVGTLGSWSLRQTRTVYVCS